MITYYMGSNKSRDQISKYCEKMV